MAPVDPGSRDREEVVPLAISSDRSPAVAAPEAHGSEVGEIESSLVAQGHEAAVGLGDAVVERGPGDRPEAMLEAGVIEVGRDRELPVAVGDEAKLENSDAIWPGSKSAFLARVLTPTNWPPTETRGSTGWRWSCHR